MSANATVPGLAEAIEARRIMRRLTPGTFAEAAGLTRQGLADVRDGKRKRYNDRTILGVADALGWRPDWYERLLAGEAPVEVEPNPDDVAALRAEVAELRRIVERLDNDPDAP